MKDLLANQGNLGAMDWNDITTSALLSKAGWKGKIIGGTLNTISDYTYNEGFVSAFRGNKSAKDLFIDGVFEAFKLVGEGVGESAGVTTNKKNAVNAVFDQWKGLIKYSTESNK